MKTDVHLVDDDRTDLDVCYGCNEVDLEKTDDWALGLVLDVWFRHLKL